MFISNLPEVSKMLSNPIVLKMFIDIHNKYKKDPEYSLRKVMKAGRNMSKGEKIVKFEDKYVLTSFLPPIPSKAFMTNINAVKNEKTPYQDRMLSRRTGPISIYLSVTESCPHKCSYCSQKGRKKGEKLTTNQWINTIEKLQDMNTSIIGFTGGEPLTRSDLEQLIAAVDDRSITYLFTSGTGLTQDKAHALKKAGLFGVSVSLDSHIEDKHNKSRGSKNAFKDSISAIKNSLNAKLYTIIQVVATKEILNKKALFKLFAFAASLGVHEVKILEPIRSGKLLEGKDFDESLFFDQNDRKKLIDIQYKANKKRKFPKITVFANTESCDRYGCGAGTQHSYISSVGDLYPCDFTPMSFGNIKDISVNKLWLKMSKAIGIPKCSCFAQKINKEIYNLSKGKLPLSPELSLKIVKEHQSKNFPRVYRILQGDE